MKKNAAPGRLVEIDIAKGMACLLMIAAHFISAKQLPFGTFAAPLFFACSGMNTILLIEKTRGSRCWDLFHLAFPVLLFLGGSTYTSLSHGGPLRLDPGFLQVIALSLLLLFVLGRILPRADHAGLLFPLPFAVHALLPLSFLQHSRGTCLAFLFGKGFALFPWLGFFLFGVFLLKLSRRLRPWLLAALALALAASQAAFQAPLRKFWMSPAYMLLALLAVFLLFTLARGIAASSAWPARLVAAAFALPGRNALMFLYLHVFALRTLAGGEWTASPWLNAALQVLLLFFFCWVLLLAYERIKADAALLAPFLLLGSALAALRWLGMPAARGDLFPLDHLIGVLFAFVYVLLRRRAAAWIERARVKEPEESEK